MSRTHEEVLELLRRTRDQLLERCLDVTLKPKPSYNIDGQEIKWAEYLEQLTKSLKAVEDQIATKLPPYEEESVAWS